MVPVPCVPTGVGAAEHFRLTSCPHWTVPPLVQWGLSVVSTTLKMSVFAEIDEHLAHSELSAGHVFAGQGVQPLDDDACPPFLSIRPCSR